MNEKEKGEALLLFISFFFFIGTLFLFSLFRLERFQKHHMEKELTRITGMKIMKDRSDCLNQISSNNQLMITALMTSWEHYLSFKELFFSWILLTSNETKYGLMQAFAKGQSVEPFLNSFEKHQKIHESYLSFLKNKIFSLSEWNQEISQSCGCQEFLVPLSLEEGFKIGYQKAKIKKKTALPSNQPFQFHQVPSQNPLSREICLNQTLPPLERTFLQELKKHHFIFGPHESFNRLCSKLDVKDFLEQFQDTEISILLPEFFHRFEETYLSLSLDPQTLHKKDPASFPHPLLGESFQEIQGKVYKKGLPSLWFFQIERFLFPSHDRSLIANQLQFAVGHRTESSCEKQAFFLPQWFERYEGEQNI